MQVRVSQFATHVALPATLVVVAFVAGPMRGADETAHAAPAAATMQKYCFQCHSKSAAMGGIHLDDLLTHHSIAQDFQQWQKVIAVLDQHRMPPKGLPQPQE